MANGNGTNGSTGGQSYSLQDAVLKNGIQNVHYVNRRLLTAEDLTDDQKAGRAQRAQLGKAIGDGVVQGYEVTLSTQGKPGNPPILSVKAGLALNCYGQALMLPEDVTISLGTPASVPSLAGGLFQECVQAPSQLATPTGVFVFTVSPTSGPSGSAPLKSLKSVDASEGCGSRYDVEGVQFKVIEADINTYLKEKNLPSDFTDLFNATDDKGFSLLQNRLAHLCFGTEELRAAWATPLNRPALPGLLEWMRQRKDLTPCCVPLALLYWRQNTLFFLDEWAVRRPTVPLPHCEALVAAGGPGRDNVTRALLTQFQQRI